MGQRSGSAEMLFEVIGQLLNCFEVEDPFVCICSFAKEVSKGKGVVVDLRCFDVLGKMLYKLIQVRVGRCIDVKMCDLFRL